MSNMTTFQQDIVELNCERGREEKGRKKQGKGRAESALGGV